MVATFVDIFNDQHKR